MMTLDEIIEKTLLEDLGEGDHTSLAVIPGGNPGEARLILKESGIIAGIDVARKVFFRVDPDLKMTTRISDGALVKAGDIAFHVKGDIRSILAAERTVLNFMQRLSGIASYTHQLASMLKGYHAKLLDTRKTTPLLRDLEKYAVRTGGGLNHRMGLYDMILIKDNHVDYAGGIENAIRAVRDYLQTSGLKLKIEIEVRNFEELLTVINVGGVDRIMFDNFTPEDTESAVKLVNGRFETESSGGITIQNILEYAKSGVDFISVGALTHHIKSLDMSLKATLVKA